MPNLDSVLEGPQPATEALERELRRARSQISKKSERDGSFRTRLQESKYRSPLEMDELYQETQRLSSATFNFPVIEWDFSDDETTTVDIISKKMDAFMHISRSSSFYEGRRPMVRSPSVFCHLSLQNGTPEHATAA